MSAYFPQLPAGPVSTRIVRSSDGGPIRLIITGRHKKPTGRYPSLKARATPELIESFWLCKSVLV
jgi:hypothetical protein